MSIWPDEVIDSLARRRAVLFLGAGISANAISKMGKSPATWEEFLKSVVSKCQKKIGTYEEEILEYINEKNICLHVR
ncbi:MAG: hypothetical protein K5675_01305 [Lachnospiraceae bacterium]|nr:hypothetical protein [Lachnospiraceae bacterium]